MEALLNFNDLQNFSFITIEFADFVLFEKYDVN